MIIAHDHIADRVRGLWEAGGFPPGLSTGWPSVDQFYTIGMGQWTLVTGTPNSGKSEWLDALMVNLRMRDNWRFAIYSPEHWPLELHFAHIIEKFVGRPFNPGPTERVSKEELETALDWMKGRFFFCKPEVPTMEAILSDAQFGVHSYAPNWKAGVIIDPWNQLEHYRPQGMSETEYVSQTLSTVIGWVREIGAHLWLVAHPSKLQRNKDGKLPIPTPHDVSGSVHFWNKADNCVCIWRDQAEGSQEVDIHVQKVRFRHIGKIGAARLMYDRVTGRYFEKPALSRVVNE